MNLATLCSQAGWDTTKNAARASAVGLTSIRQDDDLMLAEANRPKVTHKIKITLGLSGPDVIVVNADCSCQDFRVRGQASRTLCKHLIGLCNVVKADDIDPSLVTLGMQTRAIATTTIGSTSSIAPPPPPKVTVVDAPSDVNLYIRAEDAPEPEDFCARVAYRINLVIQSMAQRVLEVIEAGRTPYLIGPSGCGKTSAAEQAALLRDWQLFELFGTESWTDAELVGIDGAGMHKPGILTRAAHAAQGEGAPVLVIITEVPRFNVKALNVLLNPLLPKSVAVARQMGIETDKPIRHFEGPFWGSEWAHADRMHFCLDGNPWGNPLDPAIRQRVVPIEVDFAKAVADCFDEPVRDAVIASWGWVRSGKADVVIDYRELTAARDPGDLDIVRNYLARLRMKDKAAASSFLKLQPALQDQLKAATA